jgi:hypothetical protein
MESVIRGKAEILQPTHWLAEVAAVLARLTPAATSHDVERLAAMEFSINDDPGVMQRATQMAIDSVQHVFDTLCYAVAIERDDARLVAADERYFAAVWSHIDHGVIGRYKPLIPTPASSATGTSPRWDSRARLLVRLPRCVDCCALLAPVSHSCIAG